LRPWIPSIISKAVEYNVSVVFVNPSYTSIIRPRCRFIADRDVVGAMNIWLRPIYAYAGAQVIPKRFCNGGDS